MKLHGARKLGSTSALLNNIDKYVKKAKIWPFWPWKRTFKAIQSNLSFDSSLVPFFWQLYTKIEKKLLNSFGANDIQMQKEPNLTFLTLKMTFRAIQPNLSFDMWFMSPKRSFMPNKRPPGLIAPLLKFCNLLGNPPINTTKGRDLIFNEGIRLLNMADNI